MSKKEYPHIVRSHIVPESNDGINARMRKDPDFNSMYGTMKKRAHIGSPYTGINFINSLASLDAITREIEDLQIMEKIARDGRIGGEIKG
jgi:hypothetical protein